MNTISKFAAITFTVLALGASAQAQSQGGGRGGGESTGGGESAGGPISFVAAPERTKQNNQRVRDIPLYNCGEGVSISSGRMCQRVLR